jgi:hypothetical protein
LTEKGLALTPVLVELATWSDKHLRDIHPTIVNGEAMEFLRNDKAAFANVLVNEIQRKTGYNIVYAIVPNKVLILRLVSQENLLSFH